MIEEYRDIKGYEGYYQVSNFGNIRSVRKMKNLKPKLDRYGYLVVQLQVNKKRKYFTIHRLVALAFIENPLNLPQVNHKNEIKTDNRVENLEWCTNKYNSSYGNRMKKIIETRNKMGLWNAEKPVIMLTFEGKPINEYKSMSEASRQNNISLGNLWSVLNGRLKHTGGYGWRFKNIN